MRRLSVLAPLLALTAACSSTSGEVTDTAAQGSNRPSASAAAQEPAESTKPSPSPTKSTTAKFGQSFEFENGISMTVSAPEPYTRDEYASGGEDAAAHLAFTVTIVNGSDANYDPSLFYATVQSGNTEAEQIFDSANGLNGSPSTAVLPGRETTFKIGFGVADPADLVMEVAPGFEYDAAIFTT